MDCSGRHGDELARPNDYLSIGKFDDEIPVHAVEGLVRVRMAMPAKLLGHDAHPDLVIIHLGERNVSVRVGHVLAEEERIDDRGRLARACHGSS